MVEESLWLAIQAAEDSRFLRGAPLPIQRSDRLVSRLLECQVRAGRDRGLFNLAADRRAPVRLYTGERIQTNLARRNVVSIETARILLLLAPESPNVAVAVRRTDEWVQDTCFALRHCVVGECAHSFVSYLRLLQLSGPSSHDLARRVQVVRELRDGTGRWLRLPFYYTVLALLGLPSPTAREELHYACPALERVRNRTGTDALFDARRKKLIERVSAQFGQRAS